MSTAAYLDTYTHDPDATLDYAIDWSEWLPDGDALSTATWTVTGADAALTVAGSPAPSHAAGIATAWLTGGTDRVDYRVTCRVTTTGGRVDDRSILVRVRER
jgi:hypothetical protein